MRSPDAVRVTAPELPIYQLLGPECLTAIVAGSPAAEAGLRVGDRVIHVNGRPFEDLRKIIGARRAGQAVRLTVMGADGTLRQVHVTLGERPGTE